ncbi:hypothetical protein WMY93_007945 [Mugilogobius chulae]|uniref:Uncharacterized protein n=1 Tax=Mugilogobius chulae TaxID=88201 RepID=A0AAW0PND0_9GOBI
MTIVNPGGIEEDFRFTGNESWNLDMFSTSPAFLSSSMYGSYRFTFELKDVLDRYSWQFCDGDSPEMRIWETRLYKQEVMYVVLVHSPSDDRFTQHPLLEEDENICAFREEPEPHFIWRPQAMCEEHRFKLDWTRDSVSAFQFIDLSAEFGRNKLRRSLRYCEKGKSTLKERTFESRTKATREVYQLWPFPKKLERYSAEFGRNKLRRSLRYCEEGESPLKGRTFESRTKPREKCTSCGFPQEEKGREREKKRKKRERERRDKEREKERQRRGGRERREEREKGERERERDKGKSQRGRKERKKEREKRERGGIKKERKKEKGEGERERREKGERGRKRREREGEKRERKGERERKKRKGERRDKEREKERKGEGGERRDKERGRKERKKGKRERRERRIKKRKKEKERGERERRERDKREGERRERKEELVREKGEKKEKKEREKKERREREREEEKKEKKGERREKEREWERREKEKGSFIWSERGNTAWTHKKLNRQVDNDYLSKISQYHRFPVPAYPRPELHVFHLSHSTDLRGLRGISADGGFRDPNGSRGLKLVWFSLTVTPADLSRAESRRMKRVRPGGEGGRCDTEESWTKPFLSKFATSPAFLSSSRYGSYRLTFDLRDVLDRYSEQFCGGKTPVMRIWRTELYQQNPSENRRFSQHPLLTEQENSICAFREEPEPHFIWRPQAMCETHRFELKKNQDDSVSASVLPGRPQWFVWDHVTLALVVEDQVLHFTKKNLRRSLRFCEKGDRQVNHTTKFQKYDHANKAVKKLWPESGDLERFDPRALNIPVDAAAAPEDQEESEESEEQEESEESEEPEDLENLLERFASLKTN